MGFWKQMEAVLFLPFLIISQFRLESFYLGVEMHTVSVSSLPGMPVFIIQLIYENVYVCLPI